MPRRACLRVQLPLLGAALALSACGSAGSSPLTRAALQTRGNSACAALHRSLASLPAPAPANTGPALSAYLSRVMSAERSEYRTLAALRPPLSEQAAYSALLHGVSHRLALLGGAATSARSGGNALGALQDAVVYEAGALPPLAQRLGLSSCST